MKQLIVLIRGDALRSFIIAEVIHTCNAMTPFLILVIGQLHVTFLRVNAYSALIVSVASSEKLPDVSCAFDVIPGHDVAVSSVDMNEHGRTKPRQKRVRAQKMSSAKIFLFSGNFFHPSLTRVSNCAHLSQIRYMFMHIKLDDACMYRQDTTSSKEYGYSCTVCTYCTIRKGTRDEVSLL
jgi:hypothetical protein